MTSTGIIRRIDDLGRVVIPKAIRKEMNIQEGEPLEIFTTKDGVLFKRYTMGAKDFAEGWLDENASVLASTGAKFTIEGATVTCEVISLGYRSIGTATCNPSDDFDPSVGMVIAWYRATHQEVPHELLY